MLAYQFDVHPTLLTVQVDMKKPQSVNKAIVLSFIGKLQTCYLHGHDHLYTRYF